MKREILTACLLAGAMCSAAFADALNVKPGLWETTVSSPTGGSAMGAGGIPPEALARMTPEQRAQVEAVMRARGGGGGQSGSQATVTKSCLTQDQLSRPLTFGQDNNGQCKISLVTSSRSRQEMSVTCDNAKFKSTGTLLIESQDSEHYTGQLQIQADVANAGGRGGMSINRKFTGKWIGSDCGDVKPREAPHP